MSLTVESRSCAACGAIVDVAWTDGVPMRSDDVHTMFPLDGGSPLILHNGCERGDEDTPELELLPTLP